jgi:predicted ATP-dependent endonuclease of OLD family
MVLVDEIDLHLHPKWQMAVVSTIAKVLPKIQFILTSHSPLVTGNLQWMNIVHLATGSNMTTRARRLDENVYGLDADQVLLSDYFGLTTTRATLKQKRITNLTRKARSGDREAAKQLLKELTKGVAEIS